MTDEIADSGGMPKRDQFPALSYRGFLHVKYDYLMQHPEPLELNTPYDNVMRALNDSTTGQAREFLREQLGRVSGKYDAIYQEALRELDEEEREREASMKQWPKRLG